MWVGGEVMEIKFRRIYEFKRMEYAPMIETASVYFSFFNIHLS